MIDGSTQSSKAFGSLVAIARAISSIEKIAACVRVRVGVRVSTEEIAAHLGVPDVAYHASILMGGASPTASLQTAAMAIAAGVADTFLICMGWNGYSALRPKPDARPTKRRMNLGPMGETVRNLYAPYGLMSAAQHYLSLIHISEPTRLR